MTAASSPLKSIQTPDLLQERLARLKTDFPDLFTNEGQLNPTELLRLTGQQGRDHFDFSWAGKSAAKSKAFAPTTAALRYDAARSVNPDRAGGNAIIEGENLEVLKLLLSAYRGQVKCIYIDPPYNTGNDFVYKDNFKEGERAYWEQTGITLDGVKMSTNTKSDGRFHSHWLNMIYPRLLVARQLLREDGVIFVSIDDNEVTHLRKVMDEVFGEDCWVGTIIWRNVTDNNPTNIAIEHESIVCYARNKSNLPAAWKSENSDIKRQLLSAGKKLIDECKTKTELESAYKLWFSENKKYLGPLDRYKYIDKLGIYTGSQSVHNPGKEGYRYDVFHPLTGQPCKQPLMGYRFPEKTMKGLLDSKKILFGDDHTKIIELKVYVHEYEEKLASVITLDGRAGSYRLRDIFSEFKVVFENPKPPQLLATLIDQSTDEGDLILDFFAGSGSTADAALSFCSQRLVQRRFIICQVPEETDKNKEAHKAGYKKISDITIERVKRVIQGYGDNPQPIDAGFKVFTLEKSTFPRADFAPDPDVNETAQLAALKAFIAEKEASLFNTLDPQAVRDEVLLKCGFQLDVQLKPIAEVTANQLYHARDQQTPPREAIVCFDSHLDTTTLEWLCHQKGHRVIVLEAALDTTGKWNLHHQLGDGLMVF